MVVQGIKKALRIKRILAEMKENKENRIRELVGLEPLESWWSQCKMGVCAAIRSCLCRAFCPCCIEVPTIGEFCCPKGSITFKLCTVGQYPHEVMKSFMFFLLGCLISMGLFVFFCLQLEVNMELALAVAIICGFILSIGLAFFNIVRCLVFLALPNFCSSKGRSFLIMYAMVLIMNHPVKDFSHNLEVLTDSATCGQSLALNETKALVEAAASPILSIISGIKTMLEHIKKFAETLRDAFQALVRAVEEIVAIIGKLFTWLGNMTNVCNKNMGRPYQKCKKCFQDGYRRCKRKLWLFSFMCSVVRLVGKVCYLARIGELLCLIVDAIKKLILEKVGPPVMNSIRDVKEMFYFNVTMEYHYEYSMNQSRPYSEIRAAIKKEIHDKVSIVAIVKGIFDNIMCFTVLLVLLKAVFYRKKYLKKDGYDNYYITKRLYEIEARRIEMGKDQVFPLRAMETFKYIPTFTYWMTKRELKKLLKGFLFWLFAAFNASYYIICDYGLFWILDLIRRKMDFRTTAAVPPHLQLHVKGQGPMADMYKAMVGVVEPVADEGLDVDTVSCLPNPKTPNYAVYDTVWTILGITFFLTIFQAYLLRIQHIVADVYYPHREKARAVWLFNHIVLTRDTFLTFSRKQCARKFKNEKDIERHSFLSRLAAKSKIFRTIMKCFGRERKYCLSCSLEGPKNDKVKFTHCINCKSPYCNDCFLWLENVCTACMNPLDYADDGELSVEVDSSENEEDKRIRVRSLNERRQKLVKKKEVDKIDSKQMVQNFHKRYGVDGATVETLGEETNNQSSSSYDTDYQHNNDVSSSENERQDRLMLEHRRRRKKKKKKTDRVTLDIFNYEFRR